MSPARTPQTRGERGRMSSFELAFNDTERAAASTIKSAASLGKLAKRLEKAAKEGNIAVIKRAQSELGNAVIALAQEVGNAVKAWPFQDDEEGPVPPRRLRRRASRRGCRAGGECL